MDIILLKASFKRIMAQREVFAETFYRRLLENYPQLHHLFEHVDLQHQYSSLITTLAILVVGIERDEDLTPALRKLGRLHHTRAIRAEHFPPFSNMLLETLAQFDSEWTTAHRQAWAEALDYCVRGMMESYESDATTYRVQINGVRKRDL